MANMTKKPSDSDPLFNMRMPARLLARLDALRRIEPDLPSKSEMARRCIELIAEQRLGPEKRK